MPFSEYLGHPPQSLNRDLARETMHRVLTDTTVSDASIAEFLTALAKRPITAPELAGFAEAIRALAVPLPFTDAERAHLVDTCGTGGDNSGTFNISTGAALVAAAAGAKIAKHGNRGITSRCGSADVLEALGVPVALTPKQSVACLRATGFAFLYAPALHPALKRMVPIRRALGFRTVFNVLGPLTNPAHAAAQVLGVFSTALVPVVAEAISQLGISRAMVISGADSVDEITLHGSTTVADVDGDGILLHRINAAENSLPSAPLTALTGGDTAANAAILHKVFAGNRGPHRDIVVLNAAAALVVGRLAADLRQGVEQASVAIDSGAVTAKVSLLNNFRSTIPRTNP